MCTVLLAPRYYIMSPSSLSSGARALLDVSSTPDTGNVEELIVRAVADNWLVVASRLGVKTCVNEDIFMNRPNNYERACRDMFDHWLRREQHTGSEARTWSTILTALSSAGFDELVKDLRREHFRQE